MSMLKLALHRGLAVLALSLLMRDTFGNPVSVSGRLGRQVVVRESVDPIPPLELPFGPLRPPPKVAWAALPALLAERIHTLGPTEVVIERQAFETIVANLPALGSSSAPVPVQEGNRVLGVRLFGVRPDTLLGMLNIENGDVLQQASRAELGANGYELGDPDQALAAYTHLRWARDFSVRLLRRSKLVSIHYAIR
jgi:general secretion pathway protein C